MEPALVFALLIVVAALTHGALILAIGTGVAFPNLLRRLSRMPTPAQRGLQPVEITLANGCPAWWLPHKSASGVVMVCHGRSRQRRWMLPLIETLARHYSVLAFDFPSHGTNRVGTTSNGWHESLSVDAALQWLADEGLGPVVLYGCSMGGAACIFSVGRQHHAHVAGVITDGTYSVLLDVFDRVRRKARLPRAVQKGVHGVVERVARYRIEDVRPVDVVPRIRVPMYFLHGDKDPLADPASAQRLADAAEERGRASFYPGGHDEPGNSHMQALVLRAAAEALAHWEQRPAQHAAPGM
jgi:pimeloyl-ACP methyl ester carboxylesterase